MHHLLIYADDDNILDRSTAALVTASKKLDLEVIAEKTKNMVMFQDQQAGQNHNIKT